MPRRTAAAIDRSRVRALLTEARAYVRREAKSPTIVLLEARRAREAEALMHRIDDQLTRRRKYRTAKEES